MAYRIDYCPENKTGKTGSVLPRILWTGSFLLLFLILTANCWPEGREVLRLLLIPGDPVHTLEAAETFLQELECGSGFASAARDLIHGILS